jgi:hypothetical protein
MTASGGMPGWRNLVVRVPSRPGVDTVVGVKVSVDGRDLSKDLFLTCHRKAHGRRPRQ